MNRFLVYVIGFVNGLLVAFLIALDLAMHLK